MKRSPPAPHAVAPLYFETQASLRTWFDAHHRQAGELLVGFWKVGSGRASITWPQSVDEALRVGWIDGVRKRIDEHRYSIRFTPRRTGSVWSQVNVLRVQALQAAGQMLPEGWSVFEARGDAHQRGYSFSDRPDSLPADMAAEFAAGHPQAWAFFLAQPPGYRRLAVHRVTSPKRPETRARRLAELIACSSAGRRLDQPAPPGPAAGVKSPDIAN